MMDESSRILGLDIGDRRVGIALSDGLRIAAHPLITMGRSSSRQELKNIARIIRKHGVGHIVVGNPLHMNGKPSPQAAKARAFGQALHEHCSIPVHMQDERLSSSAADELLDRMGHPRGPQRKAVLDQWSAVIILQDWMDAHPASETRSAPPDDTPN